MINLSASTTADGFAPLISGNTSAVSTTEANVQVKYFQTGHFANLRCRVTANSKTTSTVITIRKNGADTSCTFTIGSGVAGLFEDTTNTTTVASGDLFGIRMDHNSAEGITLGFIGADFMTTTSAGKYGISNAALAVASAVTDWRRIAGNSGGGADSSRYYFNVCAAGTVKNAAIYVSGNTRTSAVTWTARKNGADQTLVVTIGANTTGWFEDTVNSFTVANDDLLLWKVVSVAGTGTCTIQTWSIEIEATTAGEYTLYNYVNAATMNANLTRYFAALTSSNAISTSATNNRLVIRGSGTIDRLKVASHTNTGTTGAVFTVRKGGTNQTLTATVPATTTGTFSDTTNSFTYATGNDVDVIVTRAAGSGTTTFSWLVMRYKNDGEEEPASTITKIRLGTTTPTSIRLGSATITKVYLGTTQVWGLNRFFRVKYMKLLHKKLKANCAKPPIQSKLGFLLNKGKQKGKK